MTMPTDKHDNGIGNDPGFTPPGKDKAKKQQSDLMYMLLAKGGGGGGGSGGGGGGNGGGGSHGNGNNGNNGNSKDKSNTGNGSDKVKNKDIDKDKREKNKEQEKAKKGYRQKGKYTNKGKHKGWYKNGKIPTEQQGAKVEIEYYLNDVSDPLTQVLMTYDDKGFNAAYTYGNERIEVEAVDETRPESQDPLYYLYDGLGSVSYMVKPDGNVRDHYRYDEYGKPAPGNSKLSSDGSNVLHNTFGYTGEMWDEESNLLYLRARYYEPETGRFLSRDSYGGESRNPLSKHLYAYVQNNPSSFTDPSGNSRLYVNGQQTNVNMRNVKGSNVASLSGMADAVGASTVYYPDSKQASVTYKGKWGWYSQKYFSTYKGRIQVGIWTFANYFGIGVSWSGRGVDQVVNLNTQGTRQENYIGTISIFANKDQHAWIVFTNSGNNSVKFGAMTVKGGDSVTTGTWGNKGDHAGIWYNLEGSFAQQGYYTDRVSLTRLVTQNDLNKINSYIANNDDYGVYDNCANFAVGVWSSAGGVNFDGTNSVYWPTPAALTEAIKKQNGYEVNRAINVSNPQPGYKSKSSDSIYTPEISSWSTVSN